MADFIFLGSKITADGDCSYDIKTLPPWKERYDQPRQHIKKQRHYFADKGWHFGHLMQRTTPLEKTLILGKIKGKRRGQQRMR